MERMLDGQHSEVIDYIRNDILKEKQHLLDARLTGSHNYGVQNSNSDYDVMIVFYNELDTHLLHNHNAINNISTNYNNDIDISGMSLGTFFQKIMDTTPNAIEYLQSDKHIYESNVTLHGDEVINFLNAFLNQRSLFVKYYSWGETVYDRYIESGEDLSAKRQFHVVDNIERAKYIAEHGRLPPINTFELAGEQYSDTLFTVATAKRHQRELNNIYCDKVIDEELYQVCSESLSTGSMDKLPVDEIIKEIMNDISDRKR